MLQGDPGRIREQLEAAVAYALDIGLVAQSQITGSWNADGRNLFFSADDKVHRMAAQRFIPRQDAPQMDIFFDNPATVLRNDLCNALGNCRAAESAALLVRLYHQLPDHAELASFDRLVNTLQLLDTPPMDVHAELLIMQQVDRIAKRLLGARSRDYLTALWQRLAKPLADHPY